MMQIIKGSVPEYEGRSNIPVTYGKVGEQEYYFIAGGDLGNGNYIATTNLVEAISSKEEPKNLGIINSDGAIVIPFENKSIKIINNKYLLVVLSNPISQSVIDVALEKEKVKNSVDSLATSGLITTATAIKESVGTKMALDNGKFILNDQASEATVYDYDGNNVLNGEYYSFIGLGDTGLYLSKNVVNSPVEKFDFEQKTTASEKVQSVEETPVEKSVQEEVVDTTPVEKTDENIEVVDETQTAGVPLEESNDDETVKADIPVDEKNIEQELDVSDVDVDKEKIEEALNTDEIIEETPDAEDIEDSKLDIESDIPVVEEDTDEKDDSMNKEFDFKLNLDDYNNESNYSDDSIYNYHKSDTEKYYEEPVSRGDSILPTAISTMNNLIKQNKEQKEKIEVLDSKNNSLKDKIINFENIVSKLEGRNQSLERENRQMDDKLHSQADVIERQNREINTLREKIDNQRRSEADLANLLRTAQGVLTQDNNYSYSDDEFTYSKRAA